MVIASSEKAVPALTAPVPVEILRFGAHLTLRAIAPAELREVPRSPDGNLIADYLGAIESPERLSKRLSTTPGLVEHGLFAPGLVSDILIARDGGIEHRRGAKDSASSPASQTPSSAASGHPQASRPPRNPPGGTHLRC